MRRVSLRLAWLVTAAAAVVLDDTTIRDAVTAWLADATAAEATYGHISAWDTSQVTDLKQLFQDSIFNDDISAWDTSAVTSMFATFQNAKQFNQPLNDWEVSGVTSMVSMFAHAESFNQPLDSWDVSKVASLDSMFYYAHAFDRTSAGASTPASLLTATRCREPRAWCPSAASAKRTPTESVSLRRGRRRPPRRRSRPVLPARSWPAIGPSPAPSPAPPCSFFKLYIAFDSLE